MDPRFLRYYNRELLHLRELGGEFAKAFPKIAGRLSLDQFECNDPYVERLLEGFAFLAARVQLKIDSEFSRFTQHLLEVIYPHYLAPTPSMAVVQIQPNLQEASLAGGFKIPRGAALRGVLGRGDQTACEYRTAHELSLWPLEITKAQYTGYVADLGSVRLPGGKTPRAALRIELRAAGGIELSRLGLDRLPFFVRGSDDLAMRLHEHLLGSIGALVVRPLDHSWQEVQTGRVVASTGWNDDEAMLPSVARSFSGYRILHEYFAFPNRFMFAELSGLRAMLARAKDTAVELVLLSDKLDASLEGPVSAANLALHCTPAVNLFPRRADRIHLSDSFAEYQVIPDRTRAMDFEVHTVNEVLGYAETADVKQTFAPLYAPATIRGGQRQGFYTVRREPRMLSSRQAAQGGARSSYVGSEVFLSLVDGEEGPYGTELKQLGVSVSCTNRDLPLHMPLGTGRTDFTLDVGAPVSSIRCIAGPTPPRPSAAQGGDSTWRLVSHLSLNYLSIADGERGEGAAALRELLRLYSDLSDPATQKQIDGVRAVAASPVSRRLPLPGPTAFGRGLEMKLTCDDSAFQGGSAYLLASVLDRFFAKYVSINSFTETVLETVQRGEVARWPVRLGMRNAL